MKLLPWRFRSVTGDATVPRTMVKTMTKESRPGGELADELEYFERNKADLLGKYKDLFVLIKDGKLVGVYPSGEAAYEEGLENFGLKPFLVKQVVEVEPVAMLPMLSLTPTIARS